MCVTWVGQSAPSYLGTDEPYAYWKLRLRSATASKTKDELREKKYYCPSNAKKARVIELLQ